MSLTPENNTGLVNADTYVDLPTLKNYCTGRGVDYTALALNGNSGTDSVLENLLRIAFTYVNSEWRYKSWPLNNDQAGEFPRVNLSDGMGRIFNTVPQRVKDAQCEAAIIQGQGFNIFINAARGGMVASEGVGPINSSYQQGAPPESFLQTVQRLLNPFVRDPNAPRRMLPTFNDYSDTGKTDPIFSVGMDNNPDIGPFDVGSATS